MVEPQKLDPLVYGWSIDSLDWSLLCSTTVPERSQLVSDYVSTGPYLHKKNRQVWLLQ